ncbi:hypothetical protein [Streptomyces sp. KL2]|uniref:hypothetical protein n=1 Tax=Streptomyces sp. KL2 TaxID=3050126 RepID=UPI003979283F
MTASGRIDRVRAAAAIARLALQQIQDDLTGDISPREPAEIMRELHHEADPHDGVLGALAQLLTRAAQTVTLTPIDTDAREAAAGAVEEAAAFITDSAGMRLHLATRTLHPQGERP